MPPHRRVQPGGAARRRPERRDADALVAVEAEGADWPVLHTMRPLGVPASLWTTLFEYVSYKAALLLSSGEALGFFEDLCDPLRFACVANALEA